MVVVAAAVVITPEAAHNIDWQFSISVIMINRNFILMQ